MILKLEIAPDYPEIKKYGIPQYPGPNNSNPTIKLGIVCLFSQLGSGNVKSFIIHNIP